MTLEAPRHFAICGECGKPWPCAGWREQRRIENLNTRLERMCPACRKPVEIGHMYALIDGRYYHMAKHRARCRRIALSLGARKTSQ